MSNGDSNIEGILKKVEPPIIVERASDNDLVSPEQLYITPIYIAVGERSTTRVKVNGVMPENYVGRPVKFFQSRAKLEKLEFLSQEFYVEGKRVINSTVVLRM